MVYKLGTGITPITLRSDDMLHLLFPNHTALTTSLLQNVRRILLSVLIILIMVGIMILEPFLDRFLIPGSYLTLLVVFIAGIAILHRAKLAAIGLIISVILILTGVPPNFPLLLSPTNLKQAVLIGSLGSIIILLISFHKQQTYQTSHQEKHFRALVNHSLHPIILKDASGTVRYASRSIAHVVDYHSRQIKNKKILDLIHPDDQDRYRQFYRQVTDQPDERHTTELRMRQPDGSFLWVRNDAINLLHDESIAAIVTSFQDISKQKQLDEQHRHILEREKKARAIAEKAVHDRDRFLSIASHELRTPLTNILLQLQATLRNILTQSLADFSGQKLVKSLSTAELQSQRLATLIKDLLNVSLITTGRIDLNKEPVELTKIVESVVSRFEEQAKQYKSSLSFKENGFLKGSWDEIRLEQAISNLITNALKYGQGKPVHIETHQDDKLAYITVTDQGPGISPKDQERIFDLFHRTKEGKKVKGLGIGLYISRQIARFHDGDIEVDSKPGQGSTFTLKLPLES